jgi:hypothetical protein
MPKPTYVGVFLDRASRDLLLARVPARHSKIFADHLTIAFGKELENKTFPIGLKVEMEVLGSADDEKGQAAIIAAKDKVVELVGIYKHPHITISCAEGTKPVYSNELIPKAQVSQKWTMYEPRFMLTGVVDYFPRTLEVPDVPAFVHCGSDVR